MIVYDWRRQNCEQSTKGNCLKSQLVYCSHSTILVCISFRLDTRLNYQHVVISSNKMVIKGKEQIEFRYVCHLHKVLLTEHKTVYIY